MSGFRPRILLASAVLLSTVAGLPAGALRAEEVPAEATTAIKPAAGATPAATPTTPAAAAEGDAPATTAAVTNNRKILLLLGKRTINLVEDGQIKGSWPVAIGDPNTPTPTGTYTVQNKVVNPRYQSTKSGKVNPTIGPNGPLGDRWIGFLSKGPDQYGIHGTPAAWSWTVTGRTAVTNGCVRMLTPHVRQLFDQVDVGTPVVVRH